MRIRTVLGLIAALLMAGRAVSAQAATSDCDVAVTSIAPTLYKIVKGTGSTTFTISSGSPNSVSTSGSASLVAPSKVQGFPIRVQITQGQSNCKSNGSQTVQVTLSATPDSTGPQFTTASFSVTTISGAASVSSVTGGQFTFKFSGGNVATFDIGAAVQLAGGAAGAGGWTIRVAAQ